MDFYQIVKTENINYRINRLSNLLPSNQTSSRSLFDKMQYEIDKVSEDSFYANFLLGLPKVLDRLDITDSYLSRRQPLTESDIIQWEIRYGVRLPEDLREFYAASDGFLFKWNSDPSNEDENVTGRISVNSLNDLAPLHGYETTSDPGVILSGNVYVLKLGLQSKVFELDAIEGLGRVALVYHNVRFVPTIWLLAIPGAQMKFHFLANDFSTYMRMAIAHLGIEEWQFAFTPEGVSQMCSELFLRFAPHLLTSCGKYDATRVLRKERKSDDDYPDVPLNEIDSDFIISKHCAMPSTVVDCSPPKKNDKNKKVLSSSSKTRTPTKFKRKPLYYVK